MDGIEVDVVVEVEIPLETGEAGLDNVICYMTAFPIPQKLMYLHQDTVTANIGQLVDQLPVGMSLRFFGR